MDRATPIHPGWAVAAGLLLGLALVLVLDRITFTPLPEPMLRIVSAERSLAAHDGPTTLQDLEWEQVHLPDTAPFVEDAARQSAWYRFRFSLPEGQTDLWSIMFQRPHAALKFWVNGALVADAGVARSNLPQYRSELRYNLSRALLRPGENELLVLSVARSRPAGLGEVWFTDSAASAAYKSQRNRIEKRWPESLIQGVQAMMVVLLALFLARPKDSAYGWFAAALGAWAMHASLSLRNTPLFDSVFLGRASVAATLVVFVVCALLFVHRHTGRRASRSEHTLIFLALLACTLAFAIPSALGRSAFDAYSLFLLVPFVLTVGCLAALALLQACHTQPMRRDLHWLVMLAATLLLVGTRDWLVDLKVLGDWQASRYLPFAAPMILLVFGALLLKRYVSALSLAETLNENLVDLVAEKSAEAEQGWRELAAAQRDAARREERDRWLREMHDGVGGQLVQALAIAEANEASAELREVLQATLDELRIIFDLDDGDPQPLTLGLGQLRERLTRRLRSMGIELEWNLLALPDGLPMGWEHKLHLLRIVQELASNALKHGKPKRLQIRCHWNNDRLNIEVSDDGRGFDPDHNGSGRGLANMRRRAELLGGSIHWSSAVGQGTRTYLSIPLPLEPEATHHEGLPESRQTVNP